MNSYNSIMRNILCWSVSVLVGSYFLMIGASTALAQGISPSGGGNHSVGQNFTVTVRASGTTFDSLQGTISVTGPVSIVSFAPGAATWLPGRSPANNSQFAGIVSARNSFVVATITLRGTSAGSGRVTVSGVRLAHNGNQVGSSGGTVNFNITRAPTPPGQVTISSSSHPNPEDSYEATTAELAWSAPTNGATGYSYLLDQNPETVPAEAVTSNQTSASFDGLSVGTYYFHIRAQNADGWGPVSRFVINIRPRVDSSLAIPAVTSITTNDNRQNNIEEGTLSGITITGTGPAGFAINLSFTPDLNLPQVNQSTEGPEEEGTLPENTNDYSAPVVNEEGQWVFNINDPVKAGFYQLTAQAEREGVVSQVSEVVSFEISVAEGGRVRVITDQDKTELQQNLSEQVAGAQDARTTVISIGAVVALLILAGAVVMLRRRIITPKNPQQL